MAAHPALLNFINPTQSANQNGVNDEAAAAAAAAAGGLPDFDSLWQSYESQLESARAASSLGLLIYPKPGFVVKLFRELPVTKKGQAVEKQKFFINICSDENIGEPVTEARVEEFTGNSPSSSPSGAPEIPISEVPEQLRIPMSIGPMKEYTDVDKSSGHPILSLTCDIILNPKTIENSSQSKEFRLIVVQFIMEKLKQKYSLTFSNALEDMKFPKLRYKGISSSPDPQMIRKPNNKEKAQGKFIEEIREEEIPRGNQGNPKKGQEILQEIKKPSEKGKSVENSRLLAPATAKIPEFSLFYYNAEDFPFTPLEWEIEQREIREREIEENPSSSSSSSSSSSLPHRVELHIYGLSSPILSELNFSLSRQDFLFQYENQYFLYGKFPYSIEESSAIGEWRKKSETLVISVALEKKEKEGNSSSAPSSSSSAVPPAAPLRDWIAELGLNHPLIYENKW